MYDRYLWQKTGEAGFGILGYGEGKAWTANVSSNDIIILNSKCIAGRLTGLMTDGLAGRQSVSFHARKCR
jgi:hypothetical protein